MNTIVPPGFEDAMTPAKVNLPAGLGAGLGLFPTAWPGAEGCLPGAWLNAVLPMAPYLDAPGLRRALEIMDLAAEGARQVKVLEMFLDRQSSFQQTHDPFAIKQIITAEIQRTQVQQQQEVLFQQLQSLLVAPAAAAEPCANLERPPGLTGPEPEAKEANPMAAAWDPAERAMQPQRPPAQQQLQTLSNSLQLLSNVDPGRLFIVRRISKLGFKAPSTLRQHFAAYGAVVRVLVAHSSVKTSGDAQCHARRRPSNLGFVQMQSAWAVQQILAAGEEHEVGGCAICVQRFERQAGQGSGAAAALEENEAEGPEWPEAKQGLPAAEADAVLWRQFSEASTAFTSASAESEGSLLEHDHA